MKLDLAPARMITPGVTLVDTGYYRPQKAACYIVRGERSAAFVECGATPSVPQLLHSLESTGLRPEQVSHVIVTHVHLDHAGGAGALLRELPHAKVVVHPRGARHLIDPQKLIAGATAVYGAELLARLHGEIVPIPAERVIAASDGFVVDLGKRELCLWDAPGHARHHLVVFDERTRGFFTGDTFGLSYRELDGARGPFIFPTTTPIQFDPEALCASIDRMLAVNPQRMYLTHYGMVAGSINELGATLKRQVESFAELGRRAATASDPGTALRTGMTTLLQEELEAHGLGPFDSKAQEFWWPDIELNAQGIAAWLGSAKVA